MTNSLQIILKYLVPFKLTYKRISQEPKLYCFFRNNYPNFTNLSLHISKHGYKPTCGIEYDGFIQPFNYYIRLMKLAIIDATSYIKYYGEGG